MVKNTVFQCNNPSVHSPRLGDNLVRVQIQRSNGQYKITIPRGLAKSLRFRGGEILEAFIERGDLVFRIRTGEYE